MKPVPAKFNTTCKLCRRRIMKGVNIAHYAPLGGFCHFTCIVRVNAPVREEQKEQLIMHFTERRLQ